VIIVKQNLSVARVFDREIRGASAVMDMTQWRAGRRSDPAGLDSVHVHP
jgi:hypothetical protein